MKKVHENSFVQGRELTKKLVIATCIGCALSLVFMMTGNAPMQFALIAFTTVGMVATIYVMVKFCVCPHCGKHITMGLLAIDTCPRCHRNLVTGKKGKKR